MSDDFDTRLAEMKDDFYLDIEVLRRVIDPAYRERRESAERAEVRAAEERQASEEQHQAEAARRAEEARQTEPQPRYWGTYRLPDRGKTPTMIQESDIKLDSYQLRDASNYGSRAGGLEARTIDEINSGRRHNPWENYTGRLTSTINPWDNHPDSLGG